MPTIRTISVCVLATCLTLFGSASFSADEKPREILRKSPAHRFVAQQLIVMPARGVSEKKFHDLLNHAQLEILSCNKLTKDCLVKYPQSWGDPEFVAPVVSKNLLAFANPDAPAPADDSIEQVIPNAIARSSDGGFRIRSASRSTPTDSLFGEQAELIQMGAEDAWEGVVDGSSFKTAVIDSGVDLDHPDLDGQIDSGTHVPCTNRVCNGSPTHGDSDGTSIASIIGAAWNDFGMVGVAWNTRIVSIKSTRSGLISDQTAADAIVEAIARGAKVINGSWGGTEELRETKRVLEAIQGIDAIFVASAGNSGDDISASPFYPATYHLPNMLVVMSHRDDGFPSGEDEVETNWSPTLVDLAAPESGAVAVICDVEVDAETVCYDSAEYSTSIAAAYVSGAAALFWSQYPDWNYDQIRDRILDSVVRDGNLDGYNASGGRLNLAQMMNPSFFASATMSKRIPRDEAANIDLEKVFKTSRCRSFDVQFIMDGVRESFGVTNVSSPKIKITAPKLITKKSGATLRVVATCHDKSGKDFTATSKTYTLVD